MKTCKKVNRMKAIEINMRYFLVKKLTNSSKRKHLTSRQAAIIQLLAKSAPEPVTLNALSQKLEVSSRTVLRELDAVEHWLDENDFRFLRKPGVGLAIQEDADTLALLQELLTVEQVQPSFSRKERRRQLLGMLLSAKEPIKSYVFRSQFQISEGTLSSDLDALEQWLRPYHISLIRRPGVGILLEGSEGDLRQAISNAAFEFSDQGELLKLLSASTFPAEPTAPASPLRNRALGYLDPEISSFVESLLVESEEKLKLKYTDSGYMALVIHLTLSIRRLMAGEKIQMDADYLEELSLLPEFRVAQAMAKKIGDRFQITVPREEVGFITMHLSSARVWPQSRQNRGQVKIVSARQVVLTIVERVEAELHLPFHTCTRMIEELTSHMDSMISRLSMNIHLDNSQVEEIQKNYPDIYAAVERACSVFREQLKIEDVSASEITFVTMHFVAAAETMRVEQKRIAVAVVCPSGMGASRMLAANLMRSFHNIEVRQILSAFSMDPERLRGDGIDLVISTVPLSLDFPHICVSPIPQAQDLLLITQTVERLCEGREKLSLPLQPRPRGSKVLTVAELELLTRTGEEILQILRHFTWRKPGTLQRTEELLGEAAGMFADSLLTRRIISADLASRETIASTYLPEMKIHLLHCRTSAIEHCRFGFLKLSQPINTAAGPLEGAVLLLSPQSGGSECVEVISQISMLLAEEERFLQALLSGDTVGAKALAQQALVKYFEQTMKRIGDGTV